MKNVQLHEKIMLIAIINDNIMSKLYLFNEFQTLDTDYIKISYRDDNGKFGSLANRELTQRKNTPILFIRFLLTLKDDEMAKLAKVDLGGVDSDASMRKIIFYLSALAYQISFCAQATDINILWGYISRYSAELRDCKNFDGDKLLRMAKNYLK